MFSSEENKFLLQINFQFFPYRFNCLSFRIKIKNQYTDNTNSYQAKYTQYFKY